MSFCVMDSPAGRLRIDADEAGICGVNRTREPLSPPDDPLLTACVRQLTEYFAGQRRVFDLPLHPVGTAFRLRVWAELQRIPYGQTITYGELARRVGNARASRAVGGANHHNPISIIIPCHRVIGADGSLTGYGGGLDMKAALLRLEGSLR
ncbi:MAG: methylated-DNA--[protein]-cysteine S-methyltransferase [Aristaeellaceae bacterium]